MNVSDQKVTHENVAQDDEQETPSVPAWLKAVVIGMGVAIVGMLILIVFKISAGDHRKSSNTTRAQSSISVGVGTQSLPEADFEIVRPSGAKLVSVTPVGNEVFLRFRRASGDEEIIILDRATGAISTITIP